MKNLSKFSINVHGSEKIPYAEINEEIMVISCSLDILLTTIINEAKKGMI